MFLCDLTFPSQDRYGDNEETYLEDEYNAGDGEFCLVCETKRLRMALFASLRARSIVNGEIGLNLNESSSNEEEEDPLQKKVDMKR